MEMELDNLQNKRDQGVEFFITSPVFDIHRFQQFTKRIDTSDITLIPTVLLLKSAGMARYIDRNIKGVSIPSDMIRRIQKAPDKVGECIKISGEIIIRLKDMGMGGVMVSTVGWEDKLPRVLDHTKL